VEFFHPPGLSPRTFEIFYLLLFPSDFRHRKCTRIFFYLLIVWYDEVPRRCFALPTSITLLVNLFLIFCVDTVEARLFNAVKEPTVLYCCSEIYFWKMQVPLTVESIFSRMRTRMKFGASVFTTMHSLRRYGTILVWFLNVLIGLSLIVKLQARKSEMHRNCLWPASA
jgi:hypothetical protein